MLSSKLITLLLVEYIIIFIVCLFERNYYRALYWLSAAGLQTAILLGFK